VFKIPKSFHYNAFSSAVYSAPRWTILGAGCAGSSSHNWSRSNACPFFGLLFQWAGRWKLIDRNPIELVRQSAKRLKIPLVLTPGQFRALLDKLSDPYRTMVLLAGCTGIRACEVMGLKWGALDWVFFHRRLRRLLAVELKLGRFRAADNGQMELYLRWLEKHECQPGEESPLGLILCAGKSDEHVELFQLKRSGIRVAEYLTELPPRQVLELRLHETIRAARERFRLALRGSEEPK
jgi:hypothetical protein